MSVLRGHCPGLSPTAALGAGVSTGLSQLSLSVTLSFSLGISPVIMLHQLAADCSVIFKDIPRHKLLCFLIHLNWEARL